MKLSQAYSVLNRHFSDINPVQYGWECCESGHDFGPAYREHFLIHFVTAGKGIFERGGVTYHVGKNQMFLIRPAELTYYCADEEEPWSYIWVGFTGEQCESLLGDTAFGGNVCLITMPQAAGLFEEIRSICDKQIFTETALCGKIFELLALLQKGASRTLEDQSGDYVRRTKDYIQANFALPVRIEDIASMLGIDRRYLCRIFSAEVGISPKDFLIQTRLSRAAAYLTKRDYTVGEAARSVGYDDMFNFSKMFKSRYGVSPLQYKRQGGQAPQDK